MRTRRLLQGGVLLAAATSVMLASAVTAVATPSKTSACSNCHDGSAVPVTVTAISNNGASAQYGVSAPGADALALFQGASRLSVISGSSGSFTVGTGGTYTVYAVNGPSTTSGLGVKSFTAAPAVDSVAPVTVSDAQVSYLSAATIQLSATDAGGSGVDATYYVLDGGPQTLGASAVVSAVGTHTIEYWSVDKAGNIESPRKSATFSVGLVLPTAASIVPSAKVVAYGGRVTFTGTLAPGSALVGRTVVLQSSTNGITWADMPVSAQISSVGGYSASVWPKTRMYYRVRFVGDSQFASSVSAAALVNPRVSMTRPSVPSKAYRNRSFTSSGYLKPRHSAGTYPVVIKAYRYQSGKWVLRTTVKAKASNYASYTKYSRKITLSAAGKWRLRTYHAADSKNAATYTAYRYLTVK